MQDSPVAKYAKIWFPRENGVIQVLGEEEKGVNRLVPVLPTDEKDFDLTLPHVHLNAIFANTKMETYMKPEPLRSSVDEAIALEKLKDEEESQNEEEEDESTEDEIDNGEEESAHETNEEAEEEFYETVGEIEEG
jgi:hypothetical protein